MIGKYLSEIVDVDKLEEGKLNLIVAPCGCGKTTFAKEKLKEVNEYYRDDFFMPNMLYLIDTAMGKEQLLHSKGAIADINFGTDEPYWKLPGITVMTYAGYQTLCEKAPEYNEWQNKCVIVCDELQEVIQWSKWNQGDNIHERAVGRIAYNIAMTENLVVALSATPEWIKKDFDWCINEIELTGEPRHYENESVGEYNDISLLLNKIDPSQRGIIYVSQIEDMQEYEKFLRDRGVECVALWSINNKQFPLNEKQTRTRDFIIDHQELPTDVNVLIINRACATSINIGNGSETIRPIDFMIIHTADPNIQIQARGRYRNDLKKLYIHQPNAIDEIHIPQKWLDVPLYTKEKKQLCEELGLKDENGRLLKWTSIKERLKISGYCVDDKRTKEQRYSVIYDL